MNLREVITTMSQYLDKLFRLMDLIDLKTYRRLVITSLSEDLNVLTTVFSSKDTLYVTFAYGMISMDNVLAISTQDVDGLWISLSDAVVNKYLDLIEPYVVSDLSEVVITVNIKSMDLRLTYEILTKVKKICSNCRVVTLVRVPTKLNDVDGVNLLSFIVAVSRRKLSELVLMVSDKFTTYLKLIRDSDPLVTCFNVLLRNYSYIHEYLSKHGRIGVFACLPNVGLDIFGDLTNAIKFIHHLMGDYECRLERLLMLTSFDVGSLDSVSEVTKNLGNIELNIITSNVVNADYIAVVEPSNYLIRSLSRYVTKAYDVIKVLDPSIGMDYVLEVVSLR